MVSDSHQSLQLLEFLIKNGSERVIDDARSHLSLLKMLRQFHFIDQNGKDQGVNVRNRSKELAELLGDVDRIRSERKKARANRNKFGGVEGGAMSGGMSSSGRYGGFGSESAGYGSSSSGVYGDGGGFGGNTSDFQDSGRRSGRFDEDDEYDEGSTASSARRRTGTTATEPVRAKKPDPPKPKEPEIDILAFDDDIPPETPPKEMSSNGRRGITNALDNDEDDFDDFQSASPTTAASKPAIPAFPAPISTSTAAPTQVAAPQPMAPSQGNNLTDLFSSISPAPSATSGIVSPPAPNYNISSPPPPSAFQSPAPLQQQTQPQQPRPTGYQASAPNYFTSVQAGAPASQPPSAQPGSRPSVASTNSFSKPAAKPASSGGDAFASLWSSTSASVGIKKTPTPASGGPKLADMQKQKAAAGIWGALAASSSAAPMSQPMQSNGQKSGGGAFDDLLG